MNDCSAKSKLPAPLIYLSKTGNYSFVTFIKTDARNGNQDSIRIGGIPIRTMLFLQKQLYRQFRRIKAKLP
jgi:hypothetical protein